MECFKLCPPPPYAPHVGTALTWLARVGPNSHWTHWHFPNRLDSWQRVRQYKGVGGPLGVRVVSNVKWNLDRITFFESIKAESACRAVPCRAWQIKYLRHCLGAPCTSHFPHSTYSNSSGGKHKNSCRWTLSPESEKTRPRLRPRPHSLLLFNLLICVTVLGLATVAPATPAPPSTCGWTHNLALAFNATLCGTGLSHIFMLAALPSTVHLSLNELTWKTFKAPQKP